MVVVRFLVFVLEVIVCFFLLDLRFKVLVRELVALIVGRFGRRRGDSRRREVIVLMGICEFYSV